jgi:hypothetical protein
VGNSGKCGCEGPGNACAVPESGFCDRVPGNSK